MLTSFFVGAKAFNRAGLSVARRHLAVDSLHHQPSTVSKKPVIFLDVDGVINGFYGIGRFWSDTKSIEVTVPISNKNNEMREFDIVYSPTVVRKINEWSKMAEIHWLTSWGERANTLLAPAIGLEGPFATLPHDARNDSSYKRCPTKEDCAQAFADKMHPDQLVIWLEDDLSIWVEIPKIGKGGIPSSWQLKCPACDGGRMDVMTRPNTLYVAPSYGLTPAHVALVDKYLADPDLAKDKLIYAFDRTRPIIDGSTVRTFTKQILEATPLVHSRWCPKSLLKDKTSDKVEEYTLKGDE